MSNSNKEYSVYKFFSNGNYKEVRRNVSCETAIKTATQLIHSMGSRIGTTGRIIITDGLDCTVFEWIFGQGIVFPTENMFTVEGILAITKMNATLDPSMSLSIVQVDSTDEEGDYQPYDGILDDVEDKERGPDIDSPDDDTNTHKYLM